MENSATKLKNEKIPPANVMDKFVCFQNERTLSESQHRDVRLSVNLLDRFIEGEFLNQLVVTLYPVDRGYTLALKIQNALENETALIPYGEDELLNCIDNQQLPTVLIEILEEAGAQVFYDGCVFVEVRDLRSNCKTSWNVLLKPTPQTILADAQQICNEQGWGQQELLHLESILCMATSDPLCLSPNPALGELAVNIDTATKQMHSTPLRQSRRSWCESRKRKQAEASQNPSTDFKLHNFLKKKSLLRQGIPPILHPTTDQANDSTSSPSSSSAPVQIDVSDVLRLAKPLERPKEINDCSVIPFEEYLYETDRVNGRVYLVKLTIFQRPATDEFLGQLYVDRDYKDNNSNGGASCMFSLGTRWSVQRYLQQFTEIFTEEGRKAVKITHQVANQPPRVMYTQSMREKERQREKEEQQQQQLLQQQQQQLLQQQQQQQQQQQAPQQVQVQRQQPQQVAAAQTGAVSKDSTETMHVNIASIPVKTEQVQGQTVQAKATWLDGLKSGQVTPALASLVSSLISSAQQQQPQQQQQQQQAQAQIQIQQQPIRPAGANASVANGHHQQQPQSLLRPASVRPQNITATTLGQNVQLVTTNYSIQQSGQPRPVANVRPGTALAALLTNSKATTLPANMSPGKGKIMPTEVRASTAGTSATPSANTILMGQLVRAANSGSTPVLPSYTQAIGQTSSGATVVRAIRPAVPGSTITGTIVRRQGESVAINGTAGPQRISLTVPALSALLAGTPSADSPNSTSAPANQNVPTLLERLQQQSSPSKPGGAALNNNHSQIHAIKSNLAASNNNINVQSINLANVQGTNQLQSIQVSIPRLGVPITLSLAVTSSATSSVSTASVVGSVRLTSSASGLTTAGQPISIPLSVLQQIPSAAGATGVQLLGNLSTKDGTIVPQLKVAGNTNAGSAPLASSGGQSSGSLLAQQQLQIALQRQVQMQLQQKVAAKQKSKPPNS